MKPYFYIPDIIQKQVNKESLLEYGFSNKGELKKMPRIKVKRNIAGWYNLISNIIKELKV